jgi:hypothetical protein
MVERRERADVHDALDSSLCRGFEGVPRSGEVGLVDVALRVFRPVLEDGTDLVEHVDTAHHVQERCLVEEIDPGDFASQLPQGIRVRRVADSGDDSLSLADEDSNEVVPKMPICSCDE